MELMRHSGMRLTTNIHQHLLLADTPGAVILLPIPKAEARPTSTCTRHEMMRRIFTGNKVTLSRPPRR
jgi:hypothetical protein